MQHLIKMTEEEARIDFRAGIEYIYQSFLDKSKDIFTRFVADDRGSFIYKKAKKIYYYLKKTLFHYPLHQL